MAMTTPGRDYGVDVAKDSLQIDEQTQGLTSICNERRTILRWLRTVPKHSAFAVEATGTYHRGFVEIAHQLGHRVYVIDGFRLSRYRDSVSVRAKNDPLDAYLLRRYLQHEREELRPWEPAPEGYGAVLQLLHRRERVVAARVALEQSLRDIPELKRSRNTLLRHLRRVADALERRILGVVEHSGWAQAARRAAQLEGIGALSAAALATVFQRGHFRSSDAFIAFLGLDVRARDSGQHRGKRRLSKRGDSELRRLLYNAAMSACSRAPWKAFYARHLARGLKPTQALVALARKLARVAFALMRNGTDYVAVQSPEEVSLPVRA
jgi:transposase